MNLLSKFIAEIDDSFYFHAYFFYISYLFILTAYLLLLTSHFIFFITSNEAHQRDLLPRVPQRGPNQRALGLPRVLRRRLEYTLPHIEYEARKEFFKNKQKQWLDEQI